MDKKNSFEQKDSDRGFTQAKYEAMTGLQKAAFVTKMAKEEILKLLKSDEHGILIISISSDFDKIINRLGFLGGTIDTSGEASAHAAIQDQYHPITNFMGEEIHLAKTIKAGELDPEAEQLAKYRNQVMSLYTQFETMDEEALLRDYRTDEQVLEIRGVAKMAGLEEYDTRPIDLRFIQDVNAAIKAQRSGLSEENRIQQELANKESLLELEGEIKSKEASLQTIQAAYDEAAAKLTRTPVPSREKVQKEVDSLTSDLESAKSHVAQLKVKYAQLQETSA